MKLTFNYIDLNKARELETPPEDIIQRDDSRTWVMLDRPLTPGVNQDIAKIWRFNHEGKFVRVALIPYCSIGLDPENAIAHAVALGFEAARQIHQLHSLCNIERLHLSIGNPVEELSEYLEVDGQKVDCFRYWLGISAKIS